jgi:hypothetical protein
MSALLANLTLLSIASPLTYGDSRLPHQIPEITMRFTIILAALALASGAARAATPDPSTVSLGTLHTDGTGCSGGNAFVELAPDVTALAVRYDDFTVQGSDTPRIRQSAKCSVAVDLVAPQGWSLGIAAVALQGGANLARRSNASHVVTYGVKGGSTRREIGRISLPGGFTGDYADRFATPEDQIIFTPCEGTKKGLRITTTIGITGEGTLKGDALSGSVHQFYELAWRQCEPAPVAGDEVVAISLPQGMWDGNLSLCVDLRNGVVSTTQAGTAWPGFVDATVAVQTADGSSLATQISGPAGVAGGQLEGDWHRVADGGASLLAWARDGRGDAPLYEARVSGHKRCLKLSDGGSTRQGPVTFTAAWNLTRSDW